MIRLLGATATLAAFSALMWLAWLGWDHEYHLVDGYPQGPYRAWQVLGCGASIAAAAVLAMTRLHTPLAILFLAAAATLGFAVPWGVDAASTDDSGLWVVGLVLLLGGAGSGLALVLTVAWALSSARRAP